MGLRAVSRNERLEAGPFLVVAGSLVTPSQAGLWAGLLQLSRLSSLTSASPAECARPTPRPSAFSLKPQETGSRRHCPV